MIKHGEPPYLECSSKGDRRFSAFYARLPSYKGPGGVSGYWSIEEIYQAAKIFEDGTTGLSWKDAKGKKPINLDFVKEFYSLLWDEYIEGSPNLKKILKEASGLSDIFGQEGHCCQATELWRIRNTV